MRQRNTSRLLAGLVAARLLVVLAGGGPIGALAQEADDADGFADSPPALAAPAPNPDPDPALNPNGDPVLLLAANDPLPARVARLLPELGLTPGQLGIYVRRVDESAPRLLFNADWPRPPASVEKVITSIVALDLLGPNHRWTTSLYRTGDIVDGVVQGDLIVKGYGDPYLTNDAYAGLIRNLRSRGIHTIAGDLVLDGSQLAPPAAGRDDFDGAGIKPYNALPAALSVNRQVTEVVIYHDRPSGRVGAYTDPPLSGVDLINRVTLVPGPCQGRNHRLAIAQQEPPGERPQIIVSGTFAGDCPDERIQRLILSPEQHAASAFHALWGQLGGRIDGRIRLGELPAGAVPLVQTQSRPLGELVRDINKLSNNLTARMVFLGLGLARDGPPASEESARAALTDWLSGHGFDFPELFVENGSGLSRQSRVGAGSLGVLLAWAWQQPWMPELLASLPIVGVDGTMARRLRAEPIAGHAHIKTGTVRDASCIAGFVLDQYGDRWVVVVLVNALPGRTLPAWTGHAVHHEVLRWVYEGAPP